MKTVMSAPPCQGAMKNMAIVTNPWSASASLDGLGSSALSPFAGKGQPINDVTLGETGSHLIQSAKNDVVHMRSLFKGGGEL